MERRSQLRTRHLLLGLVFMACSTPLWAQYLGPIGSPLPIQRRPIPTTGISPQAYSRSAFPMGSHTPQVSHRRSFQSSRPLYTPGNDLGTRVANMAKFEGVMRGLRF